MNTANTTPTKKVQPYTPKFYAFCAIGGALACNITHTGTTPIDLVKCRMQTGYPYKSMVHGMQEIVKNEGGLRALMQGGTPCFIGYSLQGAAKFGFYEYFKKKLADAIGEERANNNRMIFYMTCSAGAELVADVFLAPWEAVKVRMQTQPEFAKSMTGTITKMYAQEGLVGLYRNVVPLAFRQVPYTVIKLTAFERTLEIIYGMLGRPKDTFAKREQLSVSFAAGFIAGVLCAIISHPPDVIVSKMNKSPDKSMSQIISELGWRGCWSGLGPRTLMIGSIAAFQLLVYDAFKVATGLPTSDGRVGYKQ